MTDTCASLLTYHQKQHTLLYFCHIIFAGFEIRDVLYLIWLHKMIVRENRLHQNSWNILIIFCKSECQIWSSSHSGFYLYYIFLFHYNSISIRNSFLYLTVFSFCFSDVVLPCNLLQSGSWQTQGNPWGGILRKQHSYVYHHWRYECMKSDVVEGEVQF